MAKITKIDLIRDELNRIASPDDRKDIYAPAMKASWSFSRVMIIGKLRMQGFDFNGVLEILKSVPNQAGEIYFWRTVESTDLFALEARQRPECEVIQLSNYRQAKKIQA